MGETPKIQHFSLVIFAEVQFQADELLYHRFFAESQLYMYRNALLQDDWYGVIIFPPE